MDSLRLVLGRVASKQATPPGRCSAIVVQRGSVIRGRSQLSRRGKWPLAARVRQGSRAVDGSELLTPVGFANSSNRRANDRSCRKLAAEESTPLLRFLLTHEVEARKNGRRQCCFFRFRGGLGRTSRELFPTGSGQTLRRRSHRGECHAAAVSLPLAFGLAGVWCLLPAARDFSCGTGLD